MKSGMVEWTDQKHFYLLLEIIKDLLEIVYYSLA